MKLLQESSLSRIWQFVTDETRSFGVISAYVKELPESENLERHKQLAKKIRSLGYGYIEQNSGYSYKDGDTGESGITEEKSYFIPSITLKEILHLGVLFDQESVLHKDEIFALYFSNTGKIDMIFKTEDKITSFSSKDIEIAYSQLIKANKNQRVKFSYIAEKIIPSRREALHCQKSQELPTTRWINLLKDCD